MAQQKNRRSPSKSGARGKSGSAAKKQRKPIRREVGAFVCLFLSIFTVLGCFQIDAAFLNLIASLFKGLFGAGFYILPFAFLMSFLILLLHDGRPVTLRVVCTFLIVLTIGALVQLVGGQDGAEWSASMLPELWTGGMEGTAGGVVAGLLAQTLELIVSRVGAVIVLLFALVLLLLTSLNMTVVGIITAIKNRPRAEYDPPKREHRDPAEVIVNHVAEKHIERTERKRSKAAEFDLPVDEPPLPVKEPAAQEKKIVRPDEFIAQSRSQKKQPPQQEQPASVQTQQAAQDDERLDYKEQFESLIAEANGVKPASLPHRMPPLILDGMPVEKPAAQEKRHKSCLKKHRKRYSRCPRSFSLSLRALKKRMCSRRPRRSRSRSRKSRLSPRTSILRLRF